MTTLDLGLRNEILWHSTLGRRGGVQSYTDKVLGYSPIAYWPMNETSGTNADNAEGTAARDGTYIGVTVNNSTGPDGEPVGLWDGSNDTCDIYTASLDTAWDGTEGSLMAWAKVANAGVWTDGSARFAIGIGLDARNDLSIRKSHTNNQVDWYYKAANGQKSVLKGSVSNTGWVHLGLSWSDTADQLKAYYNGSQEGATVTGLNTWEAGGLGSGRCYIGSQIAANLHYSGYLCHVAIWATPLVPADFADLATI